MSGISASEPTGAPLRVLVVDDDPVITAVAASSLTSSGMAVEQAGDLKAALASMSQSMPDIVVLDARTRELAGWERSGLGRPGRIPENARLILLRPYCDRLAPTGTGLVVTGYLLRPFDPDELATAVRSVIGPDSGETASEPA